MAAVNSVPLELNVSRLTRLQALELICGYGSVTLAILEDAFGHEPVLERLELKGFVGITFTPSAAAVHGLQMLRLDACRLKAVPRVLMGAHCLRQLSLQRNSHVSIGSSDCDTLAAMPKLEKLWLFKKPLCFSETDFEFEELPVHPAPWDVDSLGFLLLLFGRFAQRHPGVALPEVTVVDYNSEPLWKM